MNMRVRNLAAAVALALVSAPVVAEEPPGMNAKFELFVRNAEQAAEFYAALGFEVIDLTDYGYATLRNGSVIISLSPRPRWMFLGPLEWLRLPPLGTEIVLYVSDLEAQRQRLIDAGYRPGKLRTQSWGNRDFRITDEDGYYVRVSGGTFAGNQSGETP